MNTQLTKFAPTCVPALLANTTLTPPGGYSDVRGNTRRRHYKTLCKRIVATLSAFVCEAPNRANNERHLSEELVSNHRRQIVPLPSVVETLKPRTKIFTAFDARIISKSTSRTMDSRGKLQYSGGYVRLALPLFTITEDIHER